MQLNSIRIATWVICLTGICALISLLAGTGVKMSSELVFIVPFYFGPSIVLAFLGHQGTKSRVLRVILVVSATVSTALWIYITSSIRNTAGAGGYIDAQAGMAVMLFAVVQWFIVVLTILAFVLLRKG